MTNPPPIVDVLLATYRGEPFLGEQLQSIERQAFRAWRLIARDDGSDDATYAILGEFRRRHPQRVVLLNDSHGRLGPVGNFSRLLEQSSAPYVAFCDQDDVWRETKLQRLLDLICEREHPDRPVLAHSDVEVVDRKLNPLAPSLWRYQKIAPGNCQWSRLLVQNVVTGCACLLNAELRRRVSPIPSDAIMHDWWCALVASLTGTIVWTDETLVRYRQHGRNDTGAKAWNARYVVAQSPEFFRGEAFRAKFAAYQRQVAAVVAHQPAGLSAKEGDLLRQFSQLAKRPYSARVAFLWRHRILKTGWLRNAALLARI